MARETDRDTHSSLLNVRRVVSQCRFCAALTIHTRLAKNLNRAQTAKVWSIEQQHLVWLCTCPTFFKRSMLASNWVLIHRWYTVSSTLYDAKNTTMP